MALFDVLLVGVASPARVELGVVNMRELADRATYRRFLEGQLVKAETGVRRSVLIPTSRLQLIVEVDDDEVC